MFLKPTKFYSIKKNINNVQKLHCFLYYMFQAKKELENDSFQYFKMLVLLISLIA